MKARAYALENAAVAFDRAGGGDVVGLTHDEDAISGQSCACLVQHLS